MSAKTDKETSKKPGLVKRAASSVWKRATDYYETNPEKVWLAAGVTAAVTAAILISQTEILYKGLKKMESSFNRSLRGNGVFMAIEILRDSEFTGANGKYDETQIRNSRHLGNVMGLVQKSNGTKYIARSTPFHLRNPYKLYYFIERLARVQGALKCMDPGSNSPFLCDVKMVVEVLPAWYNVWFLSKDFMAVLDEKFFKDVNNGAEIRRLIADSFDVLSLAHKEDVTINNLEEPGSIFIVKSGNRDRDVKFGNLWNACLGDECVTVAPSSMPTARERDVKALAEQWFTLLQAKREQLQEKMNIEQANGQARREFAAQGANVRAGRLPGTLSEGFGLRTWVDWGLDSITAIFQNQMRKESADITLKAVNLMLKKVLEIKTGGMGAAKAANVIRAA